MISQEIKKNIIDKVNAVNDELLLEEIYHLLDFSAEETRKHIFNDTHKELLDNRIDEIANGKFLNEAEANKDLDEWLKK
jgi:hypothetical protein